MSLISLNNAKLTIAGNNLLNDVNWQIQKQDRIVLVGRNGAGKSTLLKVLQGRLTLDSGVMQKLSGITIAGLTQDVPISGKESVYHFLVSSLGETGEVLSQYNKSVLSGDMDLMSKCQQQMDALMAWDVMPKVDMMATRLGINTSDCMGDLSGGMKRRVLLAAALIASPDLLLLDEPTNHLDLESIEWLESYLTSYNGALVLVTHDREFLARVANQIVEIDRGNLNVFKCNYEAFLERRDALREAEQKQNALFDKKLAEEEVWIRTGIKARRTRNEGRVRALKSLREQYKARRNQMATVKDIQLDVNRSGMDVIEAKGVNYSIEGRQLIRDFSILLTRGDKLGILGPNGCGKTTLVRLLLGELAQDSGTIKRGTSLEVAYFDQLRRQLQEDKTVMYNVADGADHVTINGKSKHVASYLSDFLFSSERFNQPVSVLSGGEQNRLLLAKILAKPVNLLVMDEPTNDLDIETLELLEDLLVSYKGTLIIISHDRAFINEVVTSVLVYEGNGAFNEYVGGYEDYKQIKKQQKETASKKPAPVEAKTPNSSQKLNFNEQRELSQLPKTIETLEASIATRHQQMAEPDFYQQDSAKITAFNQQLAQDEQELARLYERWDELESKA